VFRESIRAQRNLYNALNTHYVHLCTVSSDVMTWNHIGTASRCIQMSLFTCSLYVRRQLVDDRWTSSQHHTANTNVKSFRRRTPILKLYMKRWRRWTPLTACDATNDLSNARGCRWVQKRFWYQQNQHKNGVCGQWRLMTYFLSSHSFSPPVVWLLALLLYIKTL